MDICWIFIRNLSENKYIKISDMGDIEYANKFIGRRIDVENFNLRLTNADLSNLYNDYFNDEILLANNIDNIIRKKINELNVH